MPYKTTSDLPDAVKKLPDEAQKMWLKVFNSAAKQYDDEERHFATAWAAVNKKYGKAESLTGSIDALLESKLTGRTYQFAMKLGTSLMSAEDRTNFAEGTARMVANWLEGQDHERAAEFREAVEDYREKNKAYFRASRNLRIILGEMLK